MRDAMTTTRPIRPTVNLHELTPDTLDELTDEEFRVLVDIDVKKGTNQGQAVPGWITEALHTTLLSRWYTTLRRALASVDGQLDSKDADYEAEKANLNMQALNGSTDAAMKLEQLTVRHYQTRSRSLRFRSGLKDVLVQADSLRTDRVKRLEHAIREHRETIGVSDPDATEADRKLWALLDYSK